MPLERGVGSSSGDLVRSRCWESASGARAGVWPLERESVSDARAGCFTLERETGLKSRNCDFPNHFLLSLLSLTFSKITIVEPLTLDSTFSLGFDIVGVIYSPLAFTKKLLIVEGFILI